MHKQIMLISICLQSLNCKTDLTLKLINLIHQQRNLLELQIKNISIGMPNYHVVICMKITWYQYQIVFKTTAYL